MKNFRLLFSVCLILGLFVGSFGIVSADDGEPPEEEITLSEEETINHNPVISFLAELTGLTDQEILDLQAEGYGLGEIAKAYRLLALEFEEGEQVILEYDKLQVLLADAKEMGWGEYFKMLELHPGLQGGIGWLFKYANQGPNEESESPRIGKPDKPGKPEHVGPPEHAKNNKDKVKGPKK
ncbi:MAG TPA: hypothetical protein VK856_10330 [Anaerolineaceae bacterium]|nr:hypothetical protein [Anaerolineaceae bacterium]